MRLPREEVFSKTPEAPRTNWIQAATKTASQRAKLETALQASTLQHIRAGQSQEQKRLRAEDELAMKSLGGSSPKTEGDDMGDVDLGGNVYNIQQPVTSFGRLAGMALLALAILGPLSALTWKYLEHPHTDTDTTSDVVIYRPDTPAP